MPPRDYICKATDEGRDIFNQLYRELEEPAVDHHYEELGEQYGLEFLDDGRSRVAYLDTEGQTIEQAWVCVVKIHKYGDNTQNKKEYENYQKVPDKVQEHLLPITDHDEDFRWLITPWVDTDTNPRQAFELEKKLLKMGWEIEDIRDDNVAMVGDKPVALDYGGDVYPIDTDVMSVEERIDLKKWKYEIE